MGQKDLRPGTHGEQAVFLVQAFLDHRLDLDHQFFVENRQHQRKVVGGILDKKDDPYPGGPGVG